MRIALMIFALFALAFFAFVEIGLAYPVAWWLYAVVAIIFALASFRPMQLREQIPQLSTFAVVCGIILTLYLFPWTSRKPFLRDLNRIQVGMSEEQVRRIMSRYMEGSGLPPLPGAMNEPGPGTLTIAGTGKSYSTTNSPAGEVRIVNSLIFRHSNDDDYGADWGIVQLSNGRVVGIEFSPD